MSYRTEIILNKKDCFQSKRLPSVKLSPKTASKMTNLSKTTFFHFFPNAQKFRWKKELSVHRLQIESSHTVAWELSWTFMDCGNQGEKSLHNVVLKICSWKRNPTPIENKIVLKKMSTSCHFCISWKQTIYHWPSSQELKTNPLVTSWAFKILQNLHKTII